MRSVFAVAGVVALSASGWASAAPDFAPNPRQAYEGFVSINPPRADVPVGALWIQGYGPTGQSAAPDNLETVRSLTGLTIDKNLQLSLSLGILDLLGVDPKARDHYTARFSELSLVKVKDVAKLPGAKGEPRIIEALKAGSVTVSSDSEIGVSGQTLGWQTPVSGQTSNDRIRTFSIEARDMFIAVHVATPELTRSREQRLRISEDGKSARIDDFLIVIAKGSCTAEAVCPPRLGVVKINTQTPATVQTSDVPGSGELKMPLPVPIADERGGLYSDVVLRWLPRCSEQKASGCAKEPRLFAHYEGTRFADVKRLDAKGW